MDDRLVVAVGVTAIDVEHRTGWFWYWLHGDHRGRGLASRAAATVAGWALTEASSSSTASGTMW